jgi:hypothetical protein
MKASLIFVFLFFYGLASLGHSREEGPSTNSRALKSEDSKLWLFTAKVTENYTMQKDTLISFMAGTKKWDKESHSSVKNLASGFITAVIENQAENPAKNFSFNTDDGEPISITVSGGGSHTESSDYIESIDGKMISANNRKINISGSAFKATVQFHYSDEYKYATIVINIKAKGSDNERIYAGEWKDYSGNIDDYFISCLGGCDISSDKTCNITKTASGYHASWKSSKNEQRNTVSGTEYINSESSLEFIISPYKEPDKPEVTLSGCSELGTEEQSNVIASGKPEGGKFRFWVEPDNLFNVQSDCGSSASLTGATPGKGTLYVEYTSPEGKTNKTSQPASCVKIDKYNGGQDIPQIALFDIDGKKLPAIINVPLSVNPERASDLVKFVPDDPGIITAVGLGDKVAFQAIRAGITTMQATTKCGGKTGPTIEVKVVNCDKKTVETLERMREAATENLKEANEELQRIANSEEFEKARDEIVESTEELLAKSALTIMGSGKIHGPVETAVEIAEAGEAVSEMVASATREEFDEKTLTATLKALGTGVTKALLGAMGVHEAAKKFGDNLGQILYHESVLESVMKNFEKADKDLQIIIRQQQQCKGEKTEPQKQDVPKTKPTPQPSEPTAKTETPPVQKPGTTAETPPVQEPSTDKPTTDEPPISPPSPTSQPRQVGLPYSPASECGCNSSQGIEVSTQGFSSLQTGTENLGKCVDNFNNGPVNLYIQTLNQLTVVKDSLAAAVKTGSAGFKMAAGKAVPRINELIGQTKSYDKAGKTFSQEFEACPKSMKSGMEIIGSAKNITAISDTDK